MDLPALVIQRARKLNLISHSDTLGFHVICHSVSARQQTPSRFDSLWLVELDPVVFIK